MKEDEGPLKGIVDLLVDWVSNDLALYLLSPQSEVVIPELVAPRELLEGSLIDEVDNSLRCGALVLDVAHPALDLVGMSQYLFLIWKILLLLKEGALIGTTS